MGRSTAFCEGCGRSHCECERPTRGYEHKGSSCSDMGRVEVSRVTCGVSRQEHGGTADENVVS